MPAVALSPEASPVDEIDMERVVSDAEYRRGVIVRLRQHRQAAAAWREQADNTLDTAAGEDD